MSDALGLGNIQETLSLGIRIAAAVVGFVVGWFVFSPVSRLAYRLAFRKAIPGRVLLPSRLLGAIVLALLVFLLPLRLGGGGGGGGGWGLFGGGSGTGTDPGTDKVVAKTSGKTTGQKETRERMDIEIIGGKRYPGQGRYYLISRQDPPKTIEEIDTYVKDKKDTLEVYIILTDTSAIRSLGPLSPRAELQKRLNDYGIPTVEFREKSAD